MSEDRRLAVLRAIVQDYVQTSEPVGSQGARRAPPPGRLRGDRPQRHGPPRGGGPDPRAAHLGGPGARPTRATALFVDRLSSVKPMSAAEKSAIRTFLAGAVDLDDVVDRTVRLLSTLTRQVAVDAVPVADPVHRAPHRAGAARRPTRLMVVLIVNTGRVEQRIVDTDGDLVSRARRVVRRAAAVGAQRRGGLAAVPRGVRPALGRSPTGSSRPTATPCGPSPRALDEALLEEREERVVLAGTSNLARFGPDFPLTIGPVLEALEEHVVLLKLLGTRA